MTHVLPPLTNDTQGSDLFDPIDGWMATAMFHDFQVKKVDLEILEKKLTVKWACLHADAKKIVLKFEHKTWWFLFGTEMDRS